MHQKINKIIGLITISCLPLCGFALNTDKQKACHISSDHAVYDAHKHYTLFTGHINAKQGSSQIHASKLALTLGPHNQHILKIIGYGSPATYQTQLDKEKELLLAQADTINYYPTKNMVIFQGNAKITHGENSIKGDYIKYDLTHETVQANTSKHAKGQTTIILQPQGTQ